MASKKHVPPGFGAIVPYLTVEDPDRLIAFLKAAFDAKDLEDQHVEHPAGTTVHAALIVEGSVVEIGRASPEWKAMPGAIHLYVRDVEAAYERAVRAGAVSLHGVKEMDYGERACAIRDPSGNNWYVAAYTGPR